MSLPRGVALATEGRRQFITQRGYFTPPFVSCMLAAQAILLEWAGYRLPVARRLDATPPPNFVLTLHQATGAPLRTDPLVPGGRPTTGTSIGHTKTAMAALLPDAPVLYGWLTPAELLAELAKGAGIRIIVELADLPRHLQRWAGAGPGLHAIALIGHREVEQPGSPVPVDEVYLLDPMGRPARGYRGEWVLWSVLRPLLRVGAKGVSVTMVYKSAAVPPPQEDEVDINALFDRFGFRGKVGPSTPVYHPDTGAQVTRVAASSSARLLGPVGDGTRYAIAVATARLPGPDPKMLLVKAEHVTGAPPTPAEAALRVALDEVEAAIGDVATAQQALARIVAQHKPPTT